MCALLQASTRGFRKRRRGAPGGSPIPSSPPSGFDVQSDLSPSQRPRLEDSEDEGEDLDETANMDADYRPIPELDSYEGRYLDDRDQSELSFDGRLAAESTCTSILFV